MQNQINIFANARNSSETIYSITYAFIALVMIKISKRNNIMERVFQNAIFHLLKNSTHNYSEFQVFLFHT